MTGPEEQLRSALHAAADRTAATPPSAQLLLRAHRRHVHRRNAAVGASLAAVGVGAWGVSDLITGSGSAGGGTVRILPADSASPSPSPQPATNPGCADAGSGNTAVQPSPSPSPTTANDGLARISLPDPAPGFPVRRQRDTTATTDFGAGSSMSTRTFLVAVKPGTTRTLAPGVTETRPNGQEATVMVACHGAFPTTPDGITAQHLYTVIGTTTARGQSATVVRSDTYQIGVLLTYDGLDIAAYGDYSGVPNDPVTPDQLVTLIDALEHLDG